METGIAWAVYMLLGIAVAAGANALAPVLSDALSPQQVSVKQQPLKRESIEEGRTVEIMEPLITAFEKSYKFTEDMTLDLSTLGHFSAYDHVLQQQGYYMQNASMGSQAYVQYGFAMTEQNYIMDPCAPDPCKEQSMATPLTNEINKIANMFTASLITTAVITQNILGDVRVELLEEGDNG